jgi:uncharacterized membrane protein YphA (DoxX/SURF4 family)
VARVALTAAYWWSGFSKLANFQGAVAEVRHFGLAPAGALAAVTIAVQIGGSLLLISGCAVWIAAGALALFTVLATVVGHPFWAAPPAEHFQELNVFLEHIGLVGGFLLAAILAERNSRDM